MNNLHPRFILRQLTTSVRQSILFVLCVALSILSLVALRGFGESINASLWRNAKALSAADLIAESSFPFSQPLVEKAEDLRLRGALELARTWEFFSVVRSSKNEETQFSNLKVVEPGYPFYGQVVLASGTEFTAQLQPGTVIAEQSILDRLGLAVGDSLLVGNAILTIADVVTQEPDRPINLLSVGPRLFVHAADLESLGLVKEGSRVTYKMLFKVNDETQLNALFDELRSARDPRLEAIQNYRTRRTGASFFFDAFLTFLGLVAIFTLLLAGIGIQSALTAFLRERNTTIAIVKVLGATGRFVNRNFLSVAAILGCVGALLGIVLGFGLQWLFPWLFRDLLPPDLQLLISWRVLGESLLIGVVVVGAFTFLPIYQLEELRPSFILRKEVAHITRGLPFWAILLLIVLFFLAMVFWQLGSRLSALYFVGGALALIGLASLLSWLALWSIRRLRIKALRLRIAQRGLFRPRNATLAILVTFSSALAVLFTLYLLERDLNANFVQSYPPDAPNMFLIDIQREQVAGVRELVGVSAEFYPAIRGTVELINGELPRRFENSEEVDASNAPTDVQTDGDQAGAAQPSARGEAGTQAEPTTTRRAWVFNLTYRDALIEGEGLTQGASLFDPVLGEAQVSVLDEILEDFDMKLGDRVQFKIQGVPIEATISSVRTRLSEEGIRPFFVFVFPTAFLQDAPQTIFTTLHLPPAEIRPMQNKIVARFPNITVVDASEAIRTIAGVVAQLTWVIRFFTLFSLLAGILIVISSVFATRMTRIQEAAYYKVMGATSRFVLLVFTYENLLLGAIAALLALGMAQISAWLLSNYLLDVQHQPAFVASVLLVLLTMAVVTLVGLLSSITILRSRPISYLRQNSGEE